MIHVLILEKYITSIFILMFKYQSILNY